MKLKLPKVTASGHREVARALWPNAPNLPTAAERARALHHAELHAHPARALDADLDQDQKLERNRERAK